MKKSIADQLKEHLSSITKEEFATKWAEIEALGLQGPTAEVFVCSWQSLNAQLVHSNPPPRNITIPKKLTPVYRGLSFFSNLAL